MSSSSSRFSIFRLILPMVMCLAQVTAPLNALAESSAFKTGQSYYRTGDFEEAFGYFAQACDEQPGNVLAHYYFANTCAQLARAPLAVQEYETCLRLRPSAPMRTYCLEALQGYGVLRSSNPAPRLIAAPRPAAPPAAPGRTTAALDRIREQVNEIASKLNQQQVSLRSGVMAAAQTEAATYTQDAQSVAQQLGSGRFRSAPGSAAYQEVQAEQQYYTTKAAEVTQQAASLAQAIDSNYQRRQEALQDEAENLSRQLADSRPGSVMLVPLGTNLYVRNYQAVGDGDDDGAGVTNMSRPVMPMRAVAQSLARPGTPSSRAANRSGAQKAPGAPRTQGVRTSVYGRLLCVGR